MRREEEKGRDGSRMEARMNDGGSKTRRKGGEKRGNGKEVRKGESEGRGSERRIGCWGEELGGKRGGGKIREMGEGRAEEKRGGRVKRNGSERSRLQGEVDGHTLSFE